MSINYKTFENVKVEDEDVKMKVDVMWMLNQLYPPTFSDYKSMLETVANIGDDVSYFGCYCNNWHQQLFINVNI